MPSCRPPHSTDQSAPHNGRLALGADLKFPLVGPFNTHNLTRKQACLRANLSGKNAALAQLKQVALRILLGYDWLISLKK